jgi:hypothetical protein
MARREQNRQMAIVRLFFYLVFIIFKKIPLMDVVRPMRDIQKVIMWNPKTKPFLSAREWMRIDKLLQAAMELY